jgi:hypothetical protein
LTIDLASLLFDDRAYYFGLQALAMDLARAKLGGLTYFWLSQRNNATD